MIQKPTNSTALNPIAQNASQASVDSESAIAQPKLTIFAIPKIFEGHVDVIQSNAIHSWAALSPHVEVILFGDANRDPRLRELADEVGAQVFPLKCSDLGTPLINDAFERIRATARGQIFCYANCDIIFDAKLLEVVERLNDEAPESFMAIGRRTDTDIQQRIDFESKQAVKNVFRLANRDGKLASIVCKDYFIYSPSTIESVPEFRVGRGNWDNWMVANSKQRGVPIIDLSAVLTVVHQNHDYQHVPGGRRKAYVSGPEARINQKLAGGRRLIKGSTANWELNEKRIRKRQLPAWQMVKDLPNFLQLLRNLLFLGYFLCCLAFPF